MAWDDAAPWSNESLGAALITPTQIYTSHVESLIKDQLITGLAHITGGGLTQNAPRMCPETLTPKLDDKSWTAPDVFKWLQDVGNVTDAEMSRTFNMGIGLVLAAPKAQADLVLERLKEQGETAYIIGELGDK